MTMGKKIAAAAAVAAMALSIGTFAFANDITTPAEPIVTVENQVRGDRMIFDWGAWHAEVTNITQMKRYATASLDVYNDDTGDRVGHDFDSGAIGYYGTVEATVSSSEYPISEHHMECWGSIYNSAIPQASAAESEHRYYPQG